MIVCTSVAVGRADRNVKHPAVHEFAQFVGLGIVIVVERIAFIREFQEWMLGE